MKILNSVIKVSSAEDNPDKLESNSYRVQSPDEAALSDFDIITIDITDSPGNSILFDVIVSAEVEIAETVRRNRETDGTSLITYHHSRPNISLCKL